MKNKGTETSRVVKWLEDGTVEGASKVHLAIDTIAETQPDNEVSDVSCCNQSRHDYSSGAIGFKGSRPLARSQSSSNSSVACVTTCGQDSRA
jgi:hypothetical protein